jgi:sugar phosphate permease
MGFTAFFEPVVNEFGWSYAQVSLAYSLRGAEVGLLAPLIGLLIDRHGPRRLMFWGIIFIGLGLILMSRTNSLGMFYGAFVLIAIGMSGINYTVVATAVVNWFRRKIGIAMGIMASGFACGGLLVPLLVRLIDIYDWRFTSIILCLVIWVICIPLTMIVRGKPEQYGYLPDGEPSVDVTASEGNSKVVDREINVTAKQAIKSRAFWHIAASLALNSLVISAIITHIMPYLSSIGIARSDSGLVAMAIPLISIPGRIGSGWLGDRFNIVKIAAILMVLLGIGVLLFSYTHIIGIWVQ